MNRRQTVYMLTVGKSPYVYKTVNNKPKIYCICGRIIKYKKEDEHICHPKIGGLTSKHLSERMKNEKT